MLTIRGAKSVAYKHHRYRFVLLLIVFLAQAIPGSLFAAGPYIQIISPEDGSRIVQEQSLIFLRGRVAKDPGRAAKIDIFLLVDTSASTASYAGADFGDPRPPHNDSKIIGSANLPAAPRAKNTGEFSDGHSQNSVLAAEVAAARRLLAQLNPETTRVGVLTFSRSAILLQPLTSNLERVQHVLEDILRAGPKGGTNMVEGIRMGIIELMGMGASEKRTDAVKVQILLTDGYPTLPIGRSKKATPEDTDLAIDAARLAGKASIAVHVFALGEEALSYPRAAVEIARKSGGTYTPVMRPADALAVVEKISIVGVDYVRVVNQTSGKKATQIRLGADGFFSSAVPVVNGRNQIDVLASASDGSNGSASTTVYYQPGIQKSLDLDIFLETERNLNREIERLGKNPHEIRRDIGRSRESPPNAASD